MPILLMVLGFILLFGLTNKTTHSTVHASKPFLALFGKPLLETFVKLQWLTLGSWSSVYES